ncbi:3-hydroxyacyl-CoA dehydrogenase NAD-binding domain-containing protein [Sulfurovum sp. zt1-1]|uniref:enoyl-CoA hydratase n=1 Tax=Sulfurovum zhangzhouensis TaxID=3019067 RepID=A0ABT7QUS8_9BACT|nr:3-hydroxyacyl-CoA dehydrogenase NAD-binding domain-containing protein [Sulfurovum zhangzhouensis]MDM5270599.1 3-hydroxyacyl-CoA dehydrogenase NAD-binding domain-containing protein [Sulfurovum zhangzhouensis]
MDYFRLEKHNDQVATLYFDTPDSQANVFSISALEAFEHYLDVLAQENTLKILFIESAKEDIFIAGADIHEIRLAEDASSVEALVKKGQEIFNKLEKLPFVTVAIIDGACLGGGLEMSLACNYRIATSHPHTRIGLPEIKLGIIPGFGGTQRLYRLIGYRNAMEYILGAKQLSGDEALQAGIIDASVPRGYLGFKKDGLIHEILNHTLKNKIMPLRKGIRWYEHFTILRSLINKIALKKVLEKTQGHYPAPLALINVMQESFGKPMEEGLSIERAAVTKLALSPESKNLVKLFLISERLRHEMFSTEAPKTILHAAVVGTGTMGSSIAWALDNQKIDVRLKVRSISSAAKAIMKIRKVYETMQKRRKIDTRHIQLNMDRITYAVNDEGFSRSDFLIEAVNEDIDVKKSVYKEFEALMDPTAVIATNTSSISISDLAKGLKHPDRFIGMHFFNPVERMPLVEVIPGELSNETTIATVINLAKRIGKTPVKVKDSPGFLVNRVLLPYLKEATLMFEEGEEIEKIDRILKDFGMPMGAFLLIDEVGVDIGMEVAKVLNQAYGERMAMSNVLEEMVKNGWLGKKSGTGFYNHGQKSLSINPHINSLQEGNDRFDEQTVIERTFYIMINEASRCLEEGVIEDVAYLDMAMVMGIGFPPFRGGLMRYADTIGIPIIVETLKRFSMTYGNRFEPSSLMITMVQNNETFYGGQ